MSSVVSQASPLVKRSIARSSGAVVAGLMTNVALSLGTDIALHAGGVYPPWFQPMEDRLWMLALGYRAVFAALSGYLTARLASRAPMRHINILITIGTLLGLLGVLVNWNKGPEFGPHWYGVVLILSGIVCTWLGGWLCARARTTPGL